MDDIKTVDNPQIQISNAPSSSTMDELCAKQKEDVAKMRASLLSCPPEDSVSVENAIRGVTVMRIYHQLTRIVRYTELMDKLEAKLYDAIENTIDSSDESAATWVLLLNIQEKLQKSMIESHKLLQPYMDVKEFNMKDLFSSTEVQTTGKQIADQETREAVRQKANQVLIALKQAG